MHVVNSLDVDAKKAAGGSVNVSRLFYSVLLCVSVVAYVTMSEVYDALISVQNINSVIIIFNSII